MGFKAVLVHGILVIDAYLVYHLGEPALAAMGLAGAFAGMLLGLLLAFSNATQIRIAQAFGSGGEIGLKTSFYRGLLINILAAGLGLIVVMLLSSLLIDRLAHSASIAANAKAYLAVFVFVIGFEAVGQCLAAFLTGAAKPGQPFSAI